MQLETKDFTNKVADIIDDLVRDKINVSDVLDDEGNQYVDLVMEGGGVLGIALVGYTYVLEQMGIRFLKIAGTSAGAINALLLASIGKGPQDQKSEKTIDYLAKCEFSTFIDGDDNIKDLIAYMLSQRGNDSILAASLSLLRVFSRKGLEGIESLARIIGISSKIVKGLRSRTNDAADIIEKIGDISPALWKILFILDDLVWREQLGLNPGRKFENWLVKTLNKEGIVTTTDLANKLANKPKLYKRQSDQGHERACIKDLKCELALITADISTETKVVFPRMANLFWKDWKERNPASYVRASMSIPYFFEPMQVECIGENFTDPDSVEAKAYREGWRGEGYVPSKQGWPNKHIFVDGGTMSNFPIAEFHQPKNVPLAPTFGVKLGRVYKRKREIENLFHLTGALYHSARHSMDNDFLNKNPDYQHLIQSIDTENHNWLNFHLDDDAKVDLFKKGAEAAHDFLKRFNWEEYKQVRKSISEAHIFSKNH